MPGATSWVPCSRAVTQGNRPQAAKICLRPQKTIRQYNASSLVQHSNPNARSSHELMSYDEVQLQTLILIKWFDVVDRVIREGGGLRDTLVKEYLQKPAGKCRVRSLTSRGFTQVFHLISESWRLSYIPLKPERQSNKETCHQRVSRRQRMHRGLPARL